ncbi:aldose epimerase family protein [uncultured Oscillibacter sp.]|uniref:aldose epimerase family protein n=1 Tax=uncultured Oscillibacter sp. TaxID=876091 RepID=UPI0025DD628D|nr:aldose epimerase family protein [uncultured Oscillibacter sp.]
MSVPIPFGTMPDGTPVELYTLAAGALSCQIITFGGSLQSLRVPDRSGKPVDVLLGFDALEPYRTHGKSLGALVGRYANRIGGAKFSLNGQTYQLAANNNGVNHLHGGLVGFNQRVWTVEEAGDDRLALSLFSPDGEEGYPGNLTVRVTYTLTEEGLTIGYRAECDRDTVCNLTNHAYFNLSGHDSGPVLDQTIQLLADRYTPTDPLSIPTGEIAPVEGTPMDLRRTAPIGARIGEDFPQLLQAGGYDHNWIPNGEAGTLRPIARAASPATGISMEVLSTLPGVQFYTGNYLDGCPAGKGGAAYANRWGFCLETQFYPDSPNHANFPSCVLRAGEVFDHTAAFRFHVE